MDTRRKQEISADGIAERAIAMIRAGKIRNHKLGNTSPIHTGEVEKAECQRYQEFLPCKNCSTAYFLTGRDGV